MNQKVKEFIRQEIKDGLAQLPENQQVFFVRIFSHADQSLSYEEVADSIPEEKLQSAMDLVERSVTKYTKETQGAR